MFGEWGSSIQDGGLPGAFWLGQGRRHDVVDLANSLYRYLLLIGVFIFGEPGLQFIHLQQYMIPCTHAQVTGGLTFLFSGTASAMAKPLLTAPSEEGRVLHTTSDKGEGWYRPMQPHAGPFSPCHSGGPRYYPNLEHLW